MWPGDLAYYVVEYGVELPPEFLVHIAARAFFAEELDAEGLQRAEEAFFS